MESRPRPDSRKKIRKPIWVLLGVGVLCLIFWRPLEREFSLQMLLRSPAPSADFFVELAEESEEPAAFLTRVWKTQKIPHRELVAGCLKSKASQNSPWFGRMEPLLVTATQDVDFSVRERAMAALEVSGHPKMFELARAQLQDPDPKVRLLGLQYLKRQEPSRGVPVVYEMLDDPDLRVVTTAVAALRGWTDQDFGVRISQSIPPDGLSGDEPPSKENLKSIHQGVERWKQWWQQHRGDYPGLETIAGAEGIATEPLPSEDFVLKDLDGDPVRLSDYRGKIVWLNFWTTWCPGCQAEIPNLISMHNRYPEKLVVLGISLDGESDVHSHATGHHHDHGSEQEPPAREAIRDKVQKFAESKGINYPVLLDPASEVGRRFNGYELPTNVLIDSEGRVRRRFIGKRPQIVMEKMVAELQTGAVEPSPLPSGRG